MQSYTSHLVRWLVAAVVMSLACLVSPTASRGDSPIYVNAAASGANNGTSWQDAYTDLQAALAAASAGQQIWVAAGTYKPTAGTDRAISFALKPGVGVYGGFAGTETALEQRDWQANVTTLSGDLLGNDSGAASTWNATMADNSFHVVTNNSDAQSNLVLDGFTIIRGMANSGGLDGDEGKGGGLFNRSGSPTLNHLVFQDNAASQGGGMYEAGSATLNEALFTKCSASYRGGGLWNAGHATLNNIVFRENECYMASGMGIQDQSSATLNRVTFSGNVGALGAALYNAGEAHLIDVTITDHTGWGGSALESYGPITLDHVAFMSNGDIMPMRNFGPATLTDVVFDSNRQGGLTLIHSGADTSGATNEPIVLRRVTFRGNQEVSGGGNLTVKGAGLYVWGPIRLLVDQALFSGNFAEEVGGAIYAEGGPHDITLNNVTISSNYAQNGGGGATLLGEGRIVINNSAIWGNDPDQIVAAPAISLTLKNVTIQGGWPGGSEHVLDRDPRFRAPIPAGAGNGGDFYLLPDSPAIDAGDNSLIPAGSITDLAGRPRIVNAIVDLGAYEFDPAVTPQPTLTSTAGPSPTPIPTRTPSPTATPTATPTSTPTATPTPTFTPAPITVVISGTGGSLISNDTGNNITVEFPPGALTTDTAITYAYQAARRTGLLGFDRFFSLTADPVTARGASLQFNLPVTITVRHPAENSAFKDTIALYWLNGTEWVTTSITATARTTDSVTSLTDHFTQFALLAHTNWTYLPMFFWYGVLDWCPPSLCPEPNHRSR